LQGLIQTMKREPPKEYQFKKGQLGNPKGHPPRFEKDFVITYVWAFKINGKSTEQR